MECIVMSKKDSLQKVLKLLNKEASTLFKKCAQSKSKIEEENKTLGFLKTCSIEYREKLKKQSEASISSYQYQRFCRFISQLDNAINQQVQTVQRMNDSHQYLILEYQLISNKMAQLQKLIENEKKAIEYINTRKENQSATDLFNQLKRK